MFGRLLMESFRRQRRRKTLAGLAILLGTTAVTAMLALATTIGDRIHKELAVYGANIVVYPQADLLDVKVGGVDVKPATGGAYLRESDLKKLKGIFWANNITGVSPEFGFTGTGVLPESDKTFPVLVTAYWFNHDFGGLKTGAPNLHPWWKLQGSWPVAGAAHPRHREDGVEVVVGSKFAQSHNFKLGDTFTLTRPGGGYAPEADIVGILSSGDATDDKVLINLEDLDG